MTKYKRAAAATVEDPTTPKMARLQGDRSFEAGRDDVAYQRSAGRDDGSYQRLLREEQREESYGFRAPPPHETARLSWQEQISSGFDRLVALATEVDRRKVDADRADQR